MVERGRTCGVPKLPLHQTTLVPVVRVVKIGDGIARHPTQIYEIMFVVAWALWLTYRRSRLVAVGDLFKAALAGYLVCRLAVDSIKPMPVVYLGFFSAIQLACITGLIALAPHSARLIRGALWARR